MPILVKCLARTAAPCPTVGCTFQPDHAKTMVVGIASRIANDDDMIARLQRLARDALTAECSAAAPFDGIANGLALFILAFNVDERMRIAELELHEAALDRLFVVIEVSHSKI